MKPTDYLATAGELLGSSRGKPRQTNLRRACSTTYYALFHTICFSCANCLASRTTKRAWTQVYRSIEHGVAKNNCKDSRVMETFPDSIQDFANMFVQMQEKRHRADYDPDANFTKSEVLNDIEAAKAAIDLFTQAPIRDRRAFATYVLLRPSSKERQSGKRP